MKKNGHSSFNLILKFEQHLKSRSFFKPGDRILVACSGGPDSVALFHLLEQLSGTYPWKLGLIHFNHQLRPGAAQQDERFVAALAKRYNTPFFCGRGNVRREAKKNKTSIEECARAMRYHFFLKIARTKKFPKIVFAHTQDDQAETVLMRILQGTGLRGLAGIREIYRVRGISFIRPLLIFTKKEILDFLATVKANYRLDQSNNSLKFVRNRIRLKLIPMLQRDYNPRLVQSLSRIPAVVKEENALFSELEHLAWNKLLKSSSNQKVELRRTTFLKLPAPLQFRMIERALKKLDPQSGLSFEAWGKLRNTFERTRSRYSLPTDIDLALTSKRLTLYKK